MNYRRAYDALMLRGQLRGVLEGYSERHHILPRCLGGDDSASNLVRLTAREHYVAHLLLVKMYPHNGKLALAAQMMTVQAPKHGGRRVTNRMFEWLRVRAAKAVGDAHRGKVISAEHRRSMSEARLGKPLSAEHKQSMRKPKSEESRQNMRQPKSEEHRRNMSAAQIAYHIRRRALLQHPPTLT